MFVFELFNEKRCKENKNLSVRIIEVSSRCEQSDKKKRKIAQVARSIQKDRSEQFDGQYKSELLQQEVGISTNINEYTNVRIFTQTKEEPVLAAFNWFSKVSTINKKNHLLTDIHKSFSVLRSQFFLNIIFLFGRVIE